MSLLSFLNNLMHPYLMKRWTFIIEKFTYSNIYQYFMLIYFLIYLNKYLKNISFIFLYIYKNCLSLLLCSVGCFQCWCLWLSAKNTSKILHSFHFAIFKHTIAILGIQQCKYIPMLSKNQCTCCLKHHSIWPMLFPEAKEKTIC